MRHQHAFRKFQKSPAHRRAMFRNMATSLLREERCETTVEKAKELRGIVEPLITLAGEDTLEARRQAYSYLLDKAVVQKLFKELGPRFKARPGGYTRVIRTRLRHGDAAALACIELVSEEFKPKAQTKGRKRKGETSGGTEATAAGTTATPAA